MLKTWPTTNRASSDDPVERFRDVVLNERECFPFYGLMRSDVLRSTVLNGNYSGSDHPLLAELALRGRFFEVPEPLFEHGEHAGRSVTAYPNERDRLVLFRPDQAGKMSFPRWNMARGFVQVVLRSPLSFRDKLRTIPTLASWARVWWRPLVFAVPGAARHVLRQRRRRTCSTRIAAELNLGSRAVIRIEPAATETPPESVGTLRTTAANSVKWAIVQVVGATGGRLVFTLILARFLGPDDFGIVAQAMIYITLAMLLLDQGFGAALVQRRDLHPADARSVATLNLVLSVGLMIVTLVCAPLVADFFRTPELTAVLRVLGIGLVLKGLAIVPLMMTRRAFEFRELALLQTSAVMIAGIVSLVSVTAGAGYWALVVQTLVGDGLVLLGLFVLQGLPRFGIHGRSLHGMFRFSIPLLASQLLSFVGYNADNIVIGRVLGATALAYYALAFRLQRFPLQVIGSAVNDVSLPIFSRLQGHPRTSRSLVPHCHPLHRAVDVADAGAHRGRGRHRHSLRLRRRLGAVGRAPAIAVIGRPDGDLAMAAVAAVHLVRSHRPRVPVDDVARLVCGRRAS